MSTEQDYKPVKTKKDFVRRYLAGEFGNRGPSWPDIDAWLSDADVQAPWAHYKLYHVRNRVAGGTTYYDVPRPNVAPLWHSLEKPEQWYITEMAPHDRNVLQGELRLTHNGLELFASTARNVAMREALKTAKNYSGFMANMMLTETMCANSREWLGVLLERYPNHVIEFSTFSVWWGTVPFHNTVFWEVRKY